MYNIPIIPICIIIIMIFYIRGDLSRGEDAALQDCYAWGCVWECECDKVVGVGDGRW